MGSQRVWRAAAALEQAISAVCFFPADCLRSSSNSPAYMPTWVQAQISSTTASLLLCLWKPGRLRKYEKQVFISCTLLVLLLLLPMHHAHVRAVLTPGSVMLKSIQILSG